MQEYTKMWIPDKRYQTNTVPPPTDRGEIRFSIEKFTRNFSLEIGGSLEWVD